MLVEYVYEWFNPLEPGKTKETTLVGPAEGFRKLRFFLVIHEKQATTEIENKLSLFPIFLSPFPKARGVSNSSIFKGKIFIYLPFTSWYHVSYNWVRLAKRLVENQYCVASFPVVLLFGQGVASDSVQIKAKALYFKYLT